MRHFRRVLLGKKKKNSQKGSFGKIYFWILQFEFLVSVTQWYVSEMLSFQGY